LIAIMCMCGSAHCGSGPGARLTRRSALRLIGAAAVVPSLSGCERLAPYIVSEATIEELGLQTWARLLQRMPTVTDASVQRQVAEVASRLP